LLRGLESIVRRPVSWGWGDRSSAGRARWAGRLARLTDSLLPRAGRSRACL
jgi:hypothetical protein